MRLIVCSDSHGRTDLLQKAVDRYPADMLIHLGDHFSDVDKIILPPSMQFQCVRGNCDVGAASDEQVLEIEGKKVFFTHGHRYHVKSGLNMLAARADALGAHLCLYGHTHLPGYEFVGRNILLCPGAICGNRTGGKSTFAYFEWQRGGQIYFQMCEV